MLSILISWVKNCTSRRTVSCQRSQTKRTFLSVPSFLSLGETDRTRKDRTYHITSKYRHRKQFSYVGGWII